MKYFFKNDWRSTECILCVLNQSEAYAPEEIRRKSVCMNEDIGEVLKEL